MIINIFFVSVVTLVAKVHWSNIHLKWQLVNMCPQFPICLYSFELVLLLYGYFFVSLYKNHVNYSINDCIVLKFEAGKLIFGNSLNCNLSLPLYSLLPAVNISLSQVHETYLQGTVLAYLV